MLRNRTARFEQSYWPVALVFGAAVLASLLSWVILPPHLRVNEQDDYRRFYEPVARYILEGRWFRWPDGMPALRYAPGYPLILAGIFGLSDLLHVSEDTLMSAAILLCTGLAAVFVYLLARTVWRVLPALVVALVWISYPFALWLTKQPNSETPFLVFFYAGMYLFCYAWLRKSHSGSFYFLSGLLIGIATLIRPVVIAWGLVLGGLLWFTSRDMAVRSRLFLITMVLLGNAVVVFPWEAWVYSTTGKVMPIISGGPGHIIAGLTFGIPIPCRQGGELPKLPQDVLELMWELETRLGKSAPSGEILSFLSEQMHTRPLTVAKLLPIKLIRSWYGSECNRMEILILLIQIPYLALILWSSGVAWKLGKIEKQLTIIVWLTALYFWGVTIVALAILRYMIPVMGLLFVLIPASFCKLPATQKK